MSNSSSTASPVASLVDSAVDSPSPAARLARAALGLLPGLSESEVLARLRASNRSSDLQQRVLAFYLEEVDSRRLHQSYGHHSTARFAEDLLGIDRRRASELVAVGRLLLSLPTLDRAFCEGRISWSKILLLRSVVVPEHEQKWLERALASSVRELALAVKQARPGGAPREPGTTRGLPEVRFRVEMEVDVLTHQKLDLAKQKLSAEVGHPVGDAELLSELAEIFLNLEADGTVPGRTRVDSSLYRIVLHPAPEDGPTGRGAGAPLVVETEIGPVPIDGNADDGPLAAVRSDCICCEAEVVEVSDIPAGREAGAGARVLRSEGHGDGQGEGTGRGAGRDTGTDGRNTAGTTLPPHQPRRGCAGGCSTGTTSAAAAAAPATASPPTTSSSAPTTGRPTWRT